jgi:hypothetical protein
MKTLQIANSRSGHSIQGHTAFVNSNFHFKPISGRHYIDCKPLNDAIRFNRSKKEGKCDSLLTDNRLAGN